MSDVLRREQEKYDRIWREKGGSYADNSPELLFLRERCPAEFIPGPLTDVLVVGAGSGQGASWLRDGGSRVLACDISDAVAARYPAGSFKRCPASALAYPDAAFDFVVCVDVIEHVPPGLVDASLAEMTRVLRPGSVLLIQARCAPSVFEPDLHLTVESHVWWQAKLDAFGATAWYKCFGQDVSIAMRRP